MNTQHTEKKEKIRLFLLALVCASCLIVVVGCNDAQVEGDYSNPYSFAQVQAMMTYHGALVAKFDGRQWWFLHGRRWIPIEAGGAREYALNQRATQPM